MKKTKTVLLSVLTVAIGQLLLKYGMNQIGPLSFSFSTLISTAVNVFSNPFVVVGFLLFASSSLLWLVAISEAELSYAYPLLGAGYALVALLSWVLFGEAVSTLRIFGIFVITSGVILMSRS
ncbi:MAG: multidrug resistance protein [Nanoarchaeota archaeon]|nr:multidrug resistance protein [Nanoarchaeota archaeon]MBU4242082.1 multidrug resistance protein [Nanoarchaeota archaeon]MBU4351534.1 multidrug resistance protein [Nanoarchaeota archaeon]MBU4456476.1 multidrug resistance protein [Nanoarchaeota archaeon]MCG2720098.1 multidrug resistance protein [Nanoarchaeota archaeon]